MSGGSGKYGRLRAASIAASLIALVALGGCASVPNPFASPEPEPAAVPPPPPPPPPPPAPPPVELMGRWKLAVAGERSCFMKFGNAGAAAEGTIAPEGGCPGKFFTSRKWTYERGILILRDHKGEPLAQLSFAGGRFEGKTTGGTALVLAR